MKCESGLKMLSAESIDLVITSPPYDEMRNYQGFSVMIEEIILKLYRVIKQGGIVVWIVGDETKDGNESATAFEHVIKFKEAGFILYDTMIYQKQNPPPKTHKRYEQCFEFMFIFSKGTPSTTNLILQPCRYAGKIRKGNTYIHDRSDSFAPQHKEGKVLNDKIRFNNWVYTVGNAEKYRNLVKRNHPAKFPILLVRDHLLSWSNKGEVVLDPFIGSGTTAIVAILLERNYIGFEISEEYYNICCESIKQLNEKIETKDRTVIKFKSELEAIKYKK
jgi:site-specific DNA-methyltransferase (adenine-specific)